jgi:hypothetical protein
VSPSAPICSEVVGWWCCRFTECGGLGSCRLTFARNVTHLCWRASEVGAAASSEIGRAVGCDHVTTDSHWRARDGGAGAMSPPIRAWTQRRVAQGGHHQLVFECRGASGWCWCWIISNLRSQGREGGGWVSVVGGTVGRRDWVMWLVVVSQ